MPDTKTLNESVRSPIDGTESVRLATAGANWRATLASIFSGLGREKLTAARTYYVRSDGSNSNTGRVDSAGGAFLTWQFAYDYVCSNLDFGGQAVTIQHGSEAGTTTFTTGILMTQSWIGGGTLYIVGNGSTTVITDTISIWNLSSNILGAFILQSIKLAGSLAGVTNTAVGIIQIGTNVEFGASTYHMLVQAYSAIIKIVGNYTISGSASAHYVVSGGQIIASNLTATLTGTPAFSLSFADARSGLITSTGMTFTGAATGPRYFADLNGVIDVGGSGANYFPGNSAGSTATGGQYA